MNQDEVNAQHEGALEEAQTEKRWQVLADTERKPILDAINEYANCRVRYTISQTPYNKAVMCIAIRNIHKALDSYIEEKDTQLDAMSVAVGELTDKINRYRDGLMHYADLMNWGDEGECLGSWDEGDPSVGISGSYEPDTGEIARYALQLTEEECRGQSPMRLDEAKEAKANWDVVTLSQEDPDCVEDLHNTIAEALGEDIFHEYGTDD